MIVACFWSTRSVVCADSSVSGDRPRLVGCGEMAARLLSQYYHCRFTDEQIASYLGANPDGSASVTEIVDCINAMGLSARAVSGTPSGLESLDSPIILHLRPKVPGEIGHFVVYLWDKRLQVGKIYDPLMSRVAIQVTSERLAQEWTGVGIIVTPRLPPRRDWFQICSIAMTSFAVGLVLHVLFHLRSGKSS